MSLRLDSFRDHVQIESLSNPAGRLHDPLILLFLVEVKHEGLVDLQVIHR